MSHFSPLFLFPTHIDSRQLKGNKDIPIEPYICTVCILGSIWKSFVMNCQIPSCFLSISFNMFDFLNSTSRHSTPMWLHPRKEQHCHLLLEGFGYNTTLFLLLLFWPVFLKVTVMLYLQLKKHCRRGTRPMVGEVIRKGQQFSPRPQTKSLVCVSKHWARSNNENVSLFWGQRTTGADQTAPSNRLSVENSIAGSQRFL